MGRAPCCDKANVKKGPWSPEEDSKLKDYIEKYGTGGNWIALPQKAGLKRCGKSCRLRWLNYLRPNIKHGEFSAEEDRIIYSLFANIGSRWSIIAAQLPGRTDNDIKNYWNTKLKKKLMAMASPPQRKPSLNFPSSHQSASLPFPSHHSLLTPLYKDCGDHSSYNSSYYNLSSSKSLTTTGSFDPILMSPIMSQNLLSNNTAATNASLFQTQEGNLGPMQCYHPMKDNNSNNNLLVFGSAEASCCSSNSDGNCSQISYGREIKQEDHHIDFHQHGSYLSNGYDENRKFILSYGDNSNNGGGASHGSFNQWSTEKQQLDGYFADQTQTQTQTQMEGFDGHHHHQFEDVKQVITSCNNNNSNGNNYYLLIDENKTQQDQKVMMYYYH